jgi:asparagine synthase (glutamine-hydrolysing)
LRRRSADPARLEQAGLIDPGVIASRWGDRRRGRRNWTYSLWTVLMLQAWLQRDAHVSR